MEEYVKAISQWIDGIPYEKAFWNNVFRWKQTFNSLMQWSNYGGIINLECFDANGFLSSSHTSGKAQVLDVGCGLSYATGNYIELNGTKMELDLHYIDPLANIFNRIKKKHHRNLPDIEFGMVEYLSDFFPHHDVDLIIIQNALDHSAMPIKGILEAFSTLKTGGILYLNHHPNEAEIEQYKGFHQFNIDEKDGQLFVWNKTEKVIIQEILGPHAEINVTRHENGHVIAIIRKISEMPSEKRQPNTDRLQICHALMEVTGKLNMHYAVKASSKYAFYNSVQFFVQALPWDVKMKIKKLIKQA